MGLGAIGSTIKSALWEFINDDAMTLAASVALYTALSLAPLLLLAVWVLGLVYSGDAQEQALARIEAEVGPKAAEILRTVLEKAQDPRQSRAAAIVGFGSFLFFASGVFAQLQYCLNRIWNVQPRADAPWWDWFRRRFWAVVMMSAIGVILLASIAASAVLTVLQDRLGEIVKYPHFWRFLSIAVPFLVYILLFALVYKILPDVEMPWREAWAGGFVTAVLFAVGKWVIGWYLGRGTTSSVYGAAGSLVVLLLWLYYTALIFFFGAELTQALARRRGERIRPSGHAEWIDAQKAREKAGPGADPSNKGRQLT
mgnify:CR=1 FL=1